MYRVINWKIVKMQIFGFMFRDLGNLNVDGLRIKFLENINLDFKSNYFK